MAFIFASVPHDENVGLLKVAFRRRRQGARAQQSQQFRRNLARMIPAMHPVCRNARKFIQARQAGVDIELRAKARRQRGLNM